MHKGILNKIFALLLILSFIFSISATLSGCAMPGATLGGNSDDNQDGADAGASSGTEDNGENSIGGASGGSETDYHDKIIAPSYKEYLKKTVKFEEIVYKRPDFESIINDFRTVISLIEENSISYEEQIKKIEELEDGYDNILTMYSLANIYNSKDTSEEFWNTEYSFVSENYPAFAGAIEDLYVAAANSPHAEKFENDYFGSGLIEEYKDGGSLTDNMIKLWADEEALEAKYSSISTSTVKVTYKNEEDTVDNILSGYLNKYGENSKEYLAAYSACMQEYQAKSDDMCRVIFIDLMKIRRLIADELGYQSYKTYAYESYGRDYSEAAISSFLDDIAEYAVPVYQMLSFFVFDSYFSTTLPSDITLDNVINNSYDAISKVDDELADIYNYMLLFELFDIELSEVNRLDGAFTSYLNSYEAPFIFISAYGDITDYSTLMHEFGHFADAYINSNSSTSIDQSEISSQGLEYLMLLYLSNTLTVKDSKYLTYSMLSGALETLIYQGFYARIEELIYALPYDDITEKNLNAAVVAAAKDFGLNEEYVNDISVAFIPHLFIYPFYVQSYCTSVIPALELYFMEIDEAGSGFEAYKKIINRTEADLDFVETVESAGLTSPFAEGVIRDIVDRIHFKVLGSHFYGNSDIDGASA